MKKSIALISILCLLFINISTCYANPVSNAISTAKINDTKSTKSSKIKWPDNKPTVNSEAAIVMEASTGAVLYSKNIHKTYFPASITKIMTALLAIENSSLGETVTFSKKAIYDVDLDSSRIGIDVGEKLTMEQCLYGIMLESANEVSYAIAEHISGNVESFADLMNKKAAELGCTDTNFVNPHGLPNPNHYTSAYDMALISRAAINNDVFRKITGTRTYAIPPTNVQNETRYLANHHKFIKGDLDYDGVIGGKTGYTSKALYTLVTFAERDGMTLISVIMHCDSIQHEYADTANLLNYGFDNFKIYNITDKENPDMEETAPLFAKYSPLFSRTTSNLQISSKGNIVLPNTADYKDAKKEIVLKPLDKIMDGENVIGSIQYTYGDTFVGSADIIYNNVPSQNVLKGSYIPTPTKSPDSGNNPGVNRFDDSNNLKPVIITIIVGCIIIGFLLYMVFIELPFRKRRNTYLEKKGRKKHYNKKDYVDF
ncbi:D-alanyl-D-alanine carboxypeptidase family protein [Anaerocolumna sp. MB42-C2]|uniref:D-alanyl-D-alanine carboxypeptidase family protein n=1 Tax=Anaerocolumna sp. MB42-C2 TaxID=3070997 RepID=UPI0027DEC297|nr:D-alanyl-D-alanine carboxypeptidase family protein [Anaerocolumna sp. MB42-C2]WMJ85400.1 D-alanyl-D-alanine carboxypeptidase family protein [Anaerocolumna sp. MB42-C2]